LEFSFESSHNGHRPLALSPRMPGLLKVGPRLQRASSWVKRFGRLNFFRKPETLNFNTAGSALNQRLVKVRLI
jgi:hypothetical protein